LTGCKCTVCGKTIHSFISAGRGTGKALLTCTRCGEKKIEPHTHSYWCNQCDYCGEYEPGVKNNGDFYTMQKDYGLILVGYEGENDSAVTIPEGITHISMGHLGNFDNHDEITEIVFPSTLKSTGMHTFSRLKNLRKVVMNEGLESISQSAFYGCPLPEIYIPHTINRIDSGVFNKITEIICHENSPAHKYAVKEKINYKLLPQIGEVPEEPPEKEIFTNIQQSGTVRHIVCLCYNGPLSNQWKPQIQDYIINSETNAGSIINQMSRITFDSFYDNTHLYNDFSLKMQLQKIYGETYGFAEAEKLALNSVYKGDLKQEGGNELKAKFFVLYE